MKADAPGPSRTLRNAPVIPVIPPPHPIPDSPLSSLPSTPSVAPRPRTSVSGSEDESELLETTVVKPKPRRQFLDSGGGRTSLRSPQSNIPVRTPSARPSRTDVFEGQGTSDQLLSVDWVEEYALAAEISDAEALEPRSLTEAQLGADWPLWQSAIHEELANLKAAGT
ncbi:hypothetical protein M422DRAFT_54132 [Sphaerobolus stellatus SS14]|uniref:Uncharacterized protein n=1 Tax=Sphaerobolus stellatus (strain SS14) TaxID=990650 RepID=A0A0C9UWJ8_SPHS4|nr:hypothetical protein M422DRAFT_54132 [Sphaerobolus stellatus SS14]